MPEGQRRMENRGACLLVDEIGLLSSGRRRDETMIEGTVAFEVASTKAQRQCSSLVLSIVDRERQY